MTIIGAGFRIDGEQWSHQMAQHLLLTKVRNLFCSTLIEQKKAAPSPSPLMLCREFAPLAGVFLFPSASSLLAFLCPKETAVYLATPNHPVDEELIKRLREQGGL